jgi:hypothetical protein
MQGQHPIAVFGSNILRADCIWQGEAPYERTVCAFNSEIIIFLNVVFELPFSTDGQCIVFNADIVLVLEIRQVGLCDQFIFGFVDVYGWRPGRQVGTTREVASKVVRAVPLLYPKLKKKYGDVVTYEEDSLAHVKTEFGFDVLEVAHGRYAPDSYHDFIGFGVSVPLLEQAFQETYGLDLKSVLSDEDKVLGSYRHDVSQLVPKATRIVWSLKKDEIMKAQPGITKNKFLYNLSRASYQKNWGKNYQPPTFGERFLAFLARVLPKIGPLRVLQLRTPTPEAERMFEASFNATLDQYRKLLTEVGTGQPDLPNDNFDTGEITGSGKYRLNDETHAKLLDALAKQNFSGALPEVRAELLEFFGHPDAPYAMKRKPKDWVKVQAQLEQLKKAAPPVVAGGADDPSLSSRSSE